jgi:hypothetical protein
VYYFFGGAAHALGVAANWLVQLVLDIYRSISNSFYVRTKEGKPMGMDARELKRLARRTVGNTLKGIASLVLASLGAGLGTVLIRPSTGTWIGMLSIYLQWCLMVFFYMQVGAMGHVLLDFACCYDILSGYVYEVDLKPKALSFE